MEKRYKNIVWDWNGTLLNDVKISHQTINVMLARRGLEEITLQYYLDIFGFPVRTYYEQIGFDFDKDDWHELSVDFVETYNSLATHVGLTEGAREVLYGIQKRGQKQYILSALQEDMLQEMVADFGIGSYFEQVCGGTNIYADGKVGRGREMLAAYSIVPEETLMVGDTLHDAEVAEALGFDFVLYTGGHNSERRLREKGDVIVEMTDLLNRYRVAL